MSSVQPYASVRSPVIAVLGARSGRFGTAISSVSLMVVSGKNSARKLRKPTRRLLLRSAQRKNRRLVAKRNDRRKVLHLHMLNRRQARLYKRRLLHSQAPLCQPLCHIRNSSLFFLLAVLPITNLTIKTVYSCLPMSYFLPYHHRRVTLVLVHHHLPSRALMWRRHHRSPLPPYPASRRVKVLPVPSCPLRITSFLTLMAA